MSETCGAHYGSNPDACYHAEGHDGTHSNRYGTTWASDDRHHRPFENDEAAPSRS